MTIGDVMAFVAGITLLCVSLWALLVVGTLLFARRAETARARLETAPLRALGNGVLMVAIGGAGGLVFINQPNGLLKLLGWILLLGLLGLGAVGGTGIALLASQRVRRWEPKLSEFAALRHGALLVVVAALVPLLGWLLVAPLLIISSLGAGFHALRQRGKVAVAAPLEAPVEAKTVEPELGVLEPTL